jgi:hypothetical protein
MRAVLLRARYVVPIGIAIILVVAGLAALGGCGSSYSETTTTAGGYSDDGAAGYATTAAPATTAFAGVSTTMAGAASDQNSTETTASGGSGSAAQPNVSTLTGESGQKIIGDAVLDIEVASGGFQTAFTNAALLADRYGGYIITSQSSASGDKGKIDAGTVAVRVPVASFSAAVADADKLGTLKNQQISTQDVTQEYVDLQARIINSQAKLDTFRKLYDKATTIQDIVQVQEVVTAAQDELEQLKGRQRYLQEHTSYSTLTINIREAGAAPVTTTTTSGAPWGVGKAFGDGAHNFVKAVNAIVRALGIIVPVLVVLAIIAYIVYRSWRWNAKRHGRYVGRPPAAPVAPTPPSSGSED